jgi:NAD+ synthase
MKKTDIIREMRVLPEIDPEFEIAQRIEFIKDTLIDSGKKTLVLGVSGGIDSTTCGRLAQLATDQLNHDTRSNQYRFCALRLPYDVQLDEHDAQAAIEFIEPSIHFAINIHPGTDGIHEATLGALTSKSLAIEDSKIDFVKGNVKARVRMAVQYEVAGLLGGLVLGTDHSAENVTGFFTKWGDGACDLAPLFGLSKRQVKRIATALGAPISLIDKTPTADLECETPQKSDEHALGVTYDEIDDFLENRRVNSKIKKHIIDIYKRTAHKRQPIQTLYNK